MNHIRNIRKQRGLAIDKVAKLLGVSPSEIGRIEAAPDIPSRYKSRLANILGVPTYALLSSRSKVNELPQDFRTPLNHVADINYSGLRAVYQADSIINFISIINNSLNEKTSFSNIRNKYASNDIHSIKIEKFIE